MIRRIRARLSYANVMATVAVFVAMAGGAYAVIKLPKNSVKTKQIKNEAVTAKKLKDGAVREGKLAEGSVVSAKIAEGAVGASKIADGSVDASKIAAGSVGAAALGDQSVGGAQLAPTVRALRFSYSRPEGDAANTTILDAGGYRITASCASAGGEPRLEVLLTTAPSGAFESLSMSKEIPGATQPFVSLGELPANTPEALVNITAADGSLDQEAVHALYTAADRSAQLTYFGEINGVADTCSFNGVLIPIS
jgi:hypothetical protein